MGKKRSVGVIIIGILFIFLGVFGLRTIFLYPAMSKNLLLLTYIISYAMVMIITGVGLFILKRWAWIMALVLLIIKTGQLIWTSIIDVRTFQVPSGVLIGLIIISICIGLGPVFYLTRPKVKAQFSPERGKDEPKGTG